MASGKEESEAFNMLKFMYQDDDDEPEDTERVEEEGGLGEQEQHEQKLQFGGESGLRNIERRESNRTDAVFPIELQDSTPVQQWDASTLSSRWERPTIVDYGHDEAAMSPEAEEGEILAAARFMHNQDADSANDDLQDRTFAVDIVMISTPTDHVTPLSVQIENSESDACNNTSKESEMDDLAGANIPENVDLLDRFLPTPPNAKCPVDLQFVEFGQKQYNAIVAELIFFVEDLEGDALEGDALDLFARITGNTEILYWEEIDKINKFLAYKRQGKSFNSEVRNRKDYRNPDFLLHAVSYQGIDQIGSCFSKDVFDPHGYDERDFYDAIEVDMKLEMERKEQEKKKSPKVDFVTGGTQQAVVLPAARNTISVSAVPSLPSGVHLHSASVSVDAVSRDSRQNKKSKWDKVDGDQKIALGGGQVAQTSVGAHASFLSAANAGSGYAMFMQHKRREAEEKRSSERKADRRS